MSNSLDQDQARRFVVGLDLGPNCLQRSAADDKNSPLAGKELTDKPGYSTFKNRREANFVCRHAKIGILQSNLSTINKISMFRNSSAL